MARFFPVRSQCQFDTPGKRRFAERLETAGRRLPLLEQRPVGVKARYPDFAVLRQPRRYPRLGTGM